MLENVNRHFEANNMLRASSKLDPALAVLILVTAACSGDVVIVRSPQKPSQHICKRVTALEGDQVHSTGWPYFSQYVSARSIAPAGRTSLNT